MSEMALELIRQAKAEGWKQLDLGNTGIVGEVPAEIWELTELEELTLSKEWWEWIDGQSPYRKSQNTGPENKISAFPAHPPKLDAVSGEKIAHDASVGLGRLTKLVLANAQVANIQPLAILSNLHYLYLNYTQVADIQPLATLSKLQYLNLGATQVADIQPLATLSKLEYLNLYDTQVADIQPLATLSKLQYLDLAGTKVADIQPLAKIYNLQKLVLAHTYVNDIYPLAKLYNLKILHLYFTQVADLRALAYLDNLQTLLLRNTLIVDIRPLSNLKNLQDLNLKHTQVSDIKSLSNLLNLQILNLSETQVDNIWPLVGLINLRNLDLNNTRVADIRPLANLFNLDYLSIFNTQVRNIRPLASLGNLQKLILSGTEVADIQPLANLSNLDSVDLAFTKVTDIFHLKRLIENNLHVKSGWDSNQGIFIDGCPLTNPPYEIAVLGNQAILNYWRDAARKGVLPVKELKLFLLGNTTAGKSTLAHVLIEKQYPSQTYSTCGANLSQTWELGDKQIRIWDFGGQEFFHATYGLFMNDSALYVVVVDPERDRDEIFPTEIQYAGKAAPEIEDLAHFPHRYWLENVRTYAPNSNALVLWNKITFDDCASLTLDASAKAMFTGDAKVMAFSSDLWGTFQAQNPDWEAMWRVFHNQLKREIESRLLKNGTIIAYYPDIRRAMDNLAPGRMWMSLHELAAICNEFDDAPTIGNILTYLSDMCGAIFYRKPQSDDLSALPARVFINPNRLNQLFYAILNWDIKQAGGHFTRDFAIQQVGQELEKMGVTDVAEADLPGFVNELLDLMQQFEIIFEVKEGKQQEGEDDKEKKVDEGKDRFVAPQYLPQDAPPQLQREKKIAKIEPKLFIQFSSYIPRHILPRFISKNAIFAKDELYWKFGVLYFVDKKSNMALVHVDYKSRIIAVEVGEHQDAATILRDILAQLRVLIGKDDLFTVSEDGQSYYPIKDPVLRTPERLLYIFGVEGTSRSRSEEESEYSLRKIKEKLDVIVGQNAETQQLIKDQSQQLLHQVLSQNSQIRDQLMALLHRLDDKADQQLQALADHQALLSAMDQAIVQGLPALETDLQDEINALKPPANAGLLDRFKINLVKLVAVGGAVGVFGPAGVAIAPFLDAFGLEVTGAELKGLAEKLMMKLKG